MGADYTMPAGTITALRAQANDPQRVNVFINGEFAIGVSLNTISKQGLYVGKALSEEGFARVERAEGGDKALQAALRFLESRPRSVAEVRERLRRKEFAGEAIEAAIERLIELGMLDDASFARFWVENRQACRPRGAGALRDELRRKGIDRAVAESVLSDEELTGDETGRAMMLARAALRKYAGAPDRSAFQRRMGGYLQRRGFGFDTIGPILDTLWAELSEHRTEIAE
jgi:regulatory protein